MYVAYGAYLSFRHFIQSTLSNIIITHINFTVRAFVWIIVSTKSWILKILVRDDYFADEVIHNSWYVQIFFVSMACVKRTRTWFMIYTYVWHIYPHMWTCPHEFINSMCVIISVWLTDLKYLRRIDVYYINRPWFNQAQSSYVILYSWKYNA